MSLRVATNVASIAAQKTMSSSNRAIEKSFAQLSSGSRITKAADDAAEEHAAELAQGEEAAIHSDPLEPVTPSGNEVTLPDGTVGEKPDFRWLMSSDVCKHCTHAACLDVCPTGSLFRTEFGTVVVQDDICNGCGYCVPACPYGVIDRRKGDTDGKAVLNEGVAQKCTLCYDRLKADQKPACAQACPTESIQFGDVEELRERADRRVAQLHEAGIMDARLYGNDPDDGVGGAGAFFLLLDEPEVYGLPPDPVVTTRDLPAMWRRLCVVMPARLVRLDPIQPPDRPNVSDAHADGRPVGRDPGPRPPDRRRTRIARYRC